MGSAPSARSHINSGYFCSNINAAVMSTGYAEAGATIGPPMTFGYIPALDLAETCR
jgi:3-oxosteroid 1-dehydrogenase